jgi:choline dehydrogenase-like flavoprotein
VLALAALAAPAAADQASGYNVHSPHRRLVQRSVTSDPASVANQNFDFVVVGGGIGGLVTGSRLAEWSNQTVLILEAGGDGSDVVQQQNIPGFTYHKGLAYSSPYGWNYTTTAQSEAGGAVKAYPLGRGLGGSGAINGMFWGKASAVEYDSWSAELFPEGKYKWNWASMDAAIKKATTLQEPPAEQKEQFQIPVDPSAHGTDGPLQIGWSKYIYPFTANWIPTWISLGLPISDHSSGDPHGGTIVPSTMDSRNGQRSDSRRGYIDNNNSPNLVVLTGQMGTKIVFSDKKDKNGNVVATGVQFAAADGATTYTVTANKEVIVAGGTVHSPKLLQLSGIGPKAHLESQGITSLVDLPVGFNLQDHVATSMTFNTVEGVETWGELSTNPELAAAELEKWNTDRSGKWTYVNEATGYISMGDIAGAEANAITDAIDEAALVAQLSSRHNIPASVQKGMATQFALQKKWMKSNIGQIEIILHMWGSSATAVVLQCALQHPFSRGTVMVNGSNPFNMPIINPDYFSASADATMMEYAHGWLRNFATAKPIGDFLTGELTPGANVTGAALQEAFRKSAGTEYHPLGTCAMLPQEDGGVVDTSLKVYGTANVRVVDSSVIPTHISSHTMGTTYGVAEFGADIIKTENTKDFLNPPVSSSGSSKPTGSTSGAVKPTGTAADASPASSDEGLSTGAKIGIGLGVGLGGAALLGAALFFFCRRKSEKAGAASTDKGWYENGQQNNQWSNGQ